MKRTTTLMLTALLALAVAGLAIAQDRQGKKTEAVAAAFTATATGTAKSTTCTGADGTYKVTRASYAGTSTGDPKLAGKVALRVESVVNETNGLGWTKGKLVFRDADGKLLAKTELVAVNTGKTVLNGFLTGQVKGAGRLVANFSGSLGADGGSVSGELGAGAAVNSAVVTGGACDRKKRDGDDD